MNLQQIIYTSLTGSTGVTSQTATRIYHKHLPIGFKTNEITTVFIFNTSSSEGSFDDYCEIEILTLEVKLNYYKSSDLYTLAEEVKQTILTIDNDQIKYIEFLDDSLVYNPNFEFYNLNLRFSIHYEKQ